MADTTVASPTRAKAAGSSGGHADMERPLAYTTFLWRRPCTSMLLVFLLSLVLVIIQFFTQEIRINDIGNFYAQDEVYARQNDAVGGLSVTATPTNASLKEPLQSEPAGGLTLVYLPAQTATDVLTEAVMLKLDAFERIITDHKDWPKYCYIPEGLGKCAAPFSLTHMPLPGASRDADGKLVFTDFGAWRQAIVDDLNSDKPNFRPFLDREFPAKSSVAGVGLTSITMGQPLTGFTSPWQQEDCDKSELAEGETCPDKKNADGKTQDQLARAFMADFSEALHALNSTSGDTTRMFWVGSGITDTEIGALVNEDIGKLMLSIVVVAGLMIVHTRSLFIVAVSMLHILWSFPCAWFVYQVVFGFKIMTQMNLMVLFVVLAVGADDVYVVYDAWNQSLVGRPHLANDPEARAAWTFRRSAGAMLVTSFTTAVAFYASLASVVPTIRVLGALAGTTVLFNYLFVISWFPAALFWWVQRGYDQRWCWQTRKPAAAAPPAKAASDAVADSGADVEAGGAAAGAAGAAHGHELRRIERFYRDTLYPFLSKARHPVLLLSIALFAVAIGLATMVEPNSRTDGDFFDDNVPVQFAINQLSKRFDDAGEVPRAHLYWGVRDVQRGTADINDKENTGTPVYDKDFKATKTLVERMADVCVEARKPEWSDIILDKEVYCWPEQLQRYVTHQMSPRPANGWAGLAEADLVPAIRAFVEDSTWPYGGGQSRNVTAKSDFEQDFGWTSDDASGTIQWWRLSFNSTLRWGSLIPAMRVQLDRWEEFEARAKSIVGADQPDFFQIMREWWSFVEFSKSLVDSAVIGVVLALSIGAGVLLLSTQNVILSVLAMFAVVCNVSSTLALLGAAGWEIGVTESISLQLIVGLSIDYVAHLAVAYQEADVDDASHPLSDRSAVRLARTKFSMVHLGVSVTGGAATSAASVFFLLLATMKFMWRFGQILLSSTIFAFFFAHALFLPLLMVAGPTHGCGDLAPLWACLRRRCGAAPTSPRPAEGKTSADASAVMAVEMSARGDASANGKH